MDESIIRRLKEELLQMIEAGESLTALRNKLIDAKNIGISQEETLQLLGNLRGDVSTEAKEDVVLELMDFAYGFCSLSMRIWDNYAGS